MLAIGDMTTTELLHLIEQYEVVSFDLFDTLMIRTVDRPADIRNMVVSVYEERYPESNVRQYPYKRGLAEGIARDHYGECTLNEIYRYIGFPESISCELKAIEEDCEIKNCVANQVMVSIARKCKAEGKRVVITSDMYLQRHVIEAILEKIGVEYDKLYLSCEFRKTKRSGELFAEMLKDLGVGAEKILHIGDNPRSDIESPRSYGIASAERIDESKEWQNHYLTSSDGGIEVEHLLRLFSLSYQGNEEYETEYRIGYTVLGPFLYSLCVWLHKMKEELAIDKLLFLARDGYLIAQCYRNLYPNDDMEYISLNKNLLRLPSLSGEDGIKHLVTSLPPRGFFLWKDMFVHLGFKNRKDLELKIGKNINEYPEIERLNHNDLLAGIYDNQLKKLFDVQQKEITVQSALLSKYLQEKGFFSKRIGLVNNSMEGSAQTLLTEYFNRKGYNIDVIGLQFSASPICRRRLGRSVKTFFDGKNELKRWGRQFRFYPLPFEHLIFEPVGTARRFVLGDDGKVTVERDCADYEKQDYALKKRIREYALSFVNDYREHVPHDIDYVSKLLYMRLFFAPKTEDGQLIGGFWDEDVEKVRYINTLPEDPSYRPKFMALFKGMPKGIVWTPGYLSAIDMPRWYCNLERCEEEMLAYAKHPIWIVRDCVFFSKRKMGGVSNRVFHLFMRIKFRVLDIITSIRGNNCLKYFAS